MAVTARVLPGGSIGRRRLELAGLILVLAVATTVWAARRPSTPVRPAATPAPALERLAILSDRGQLVVDLAVTDEGAAAIVDGDGAIELFLPGGALGPAREAMPAARRVAIAPDGAAIATGHADGTTRLWDGETGALLRTLDGDAAVESVAFDGRGSRLAVGHADGTVRLWNPTLGRGLRTFGGHRAPVRALAFSPDGAALATGDWLGGVQLWDLSTARRRLALDAGGPALGLALSPDGAMLALASWHRALVFDAVDGRRIASLPHPTAAQQVVFADEQTLVTLGSDGLRAWDASAARLLSVDRLADAPALAAASTGLRRVATARLDRGATESWRGPGLGRS